MHATTISASPDRPSRFKLVEEQEPSVDNLLDDARTGLLSRPKTLPAKYFYDARGSELFQAICQTPEYYPTRAEAALLQTHAEAIIGHAAPSHLVELGSGSAEKTPLLLEQLGAQQGAGVYVPVEISKTALLDSAERLLQRFPWLSVIGISADYERGLELIPQGGRRLFAFLGSTLGNFTEPEAIDFLRTIRRRMNPDDSFLLGADLIKDTEVLNAAYNDAQGVTAEFNLNVLHVMNRQLNAEFDPHSFAHRAFYNEEQSQIEMHLVSLREQSVAVPALDAEVHFAEGETIRTEISRKFSRASLARLLDAAGFALQHFWAPTSGTFSLTLAKPQP